MDCGQIRSLIHEFYNRLKQEIPKQSQYQEDLKSNSETIKELVSQEFKGLTKSNDEIRNEEIVIFHFLNHLNHILNFLGMAQKSITKARQAY